MTWRKHQTQQHRRKRGIGSAKAKTMAIVISSMASAWRDACVCDMVFVRVSARNRQQKHMAAASA